MSVEAPSFTPNTPSNESEQPLNYSYLDEKTNKPVFVFNEDPLNYTREAAARQLAQAEVSTNQDTPQASKENDILAAQEHVTRTINQTRANVRENAAARGVSESSTPVDTVPSYDDEELSGWEKLHEHTQLRDLETQFAAPEAAEPQKVDTAGGLPPLPASNGEKLQHPNAASQEELLGTPDKNAERVVDYNDFVAAISEMLPAKDAEKITVTSEDSGPEKVIVQKPAASEFQSVARYDDEIHAQEMARERGPSLKEKVENSAAAEKIREFKEKVKNRKKFALKRTVARIWSKLKARASAQEAVVDTDDEPSRMEELYAMKQEMDAADQSDNSSNEDDIYAQIQKRIEERKAEAAEGNEVAKHREPGFLRRIGKAASRYARGKINAREDAARAKTESVSGVHVEA